MTETIDKEIKQLKEKIEILEEQKKQLNWEDKCFKVIMDNTTFFIRVHKLIYDTAANVEILCDCIGHETFRLTYGDSNFQFAFNTRLEIPKNILISISLDEYRKQINQIYYNLNKQI